MEEEGGELSPCPLDRPCAVEEKGIAFPRPSFRQFPLFLPPPSQTPSFHGPFVPPSPPPAIESSIRPLQSPSGYNYCTLSQEEKDAESIP